MSLQIFPRDRVFQNDPTAKSLLDYLTTNEVELELGNAVLFCNFPLFREEEFLLVAQVVLISPLHGVILISTADMSPHLNASAEDIRNQLEGTFSQVFARLVKYPRLRKGRAALACNLDAVLWIPELPENPVDQDESIIYGRQALRERIHNSKQATPLAPAVFDELISVVDESKALIRPPERNVKDFGPSSKPAYRAGIHPMAHIHIGLENDIRIAVKREMSPRSFFLFVMRQMYPECWARLLESNIARRLPHYVRGSLPVIQSPFFEKRDESQIMFE